MFSKIITLWLALFLFMISVYSFADEGKKVKILQKSSPEQVITEMRKEINQLQSELKKRDNEIYKMNLDYSHKYYTYLAEKAEINLEQFRWQRRASERLLWLVVIVVFSGVLFSGLQLWRAGSIKDLGGQSSIEIEARKIKITTSIVGILVLAISIIFFYFFLIEVYRVKIVDLSKSEVSPIILEKP